MKQKSSYYFSIMLREIVNFIPVYIPVWKRNGKKVPFIT
jgi:hypothetical protein